MEKIKEGEIYFLDLGSLCLNKVKVLKVYESEVLVEFLESMEGRQELLPKSYFNK